jgi:hypothetical protein
MIKGDKAINSRRDAFVINLPDRLKAVNDFTNYDLVQCVIALLDPDRYLLHKIISRNRAMPVFAYSVVFPEYREVLWDAKGLKMPCGIYN